MEITMGNNRKLAQHIKTPNYPETSKESPAPISVLKVVILSDCGDYKTRAQQKQLRCPYPHYNWEKSTFKKELLLLLTKCHEKSKTEIRSLLETRNADKIRTSREAPSTTNSTLTGISAFAQSTKLKQQNSRMPQTSGFAESTKLKPDLPLTSFKMKSSASITTQRAHLKT